MKKKNFLKLVLSLSFVLFLIPFCFANDLKILINEQEMPNQIELVPETNLNIKFIIPKNTSIEKIDLKSSVKSYNAVIEKFLKDDLKFDEKNTEIVEQISIPIEGWIPNSKPILNIKIDYTKNGISKTYEKKIEVIINDGSKILGAVAKILPKSVVSFVLKFF